MLAPELRYFPCCTGTDSSILCSAGWESAVLGAAMCLQLLSAAGRHAGELSTAYPQEPTYPQVIHRLRPKSTYPQGYPQTCPQFINMPKNVTLYRKTSIARNPCSASIPRVFRLSVCRKTSTKHIPCKAGRRAEKENYSMKPRACNYFSSFLDTWHALRLYVGKRKLRGKAKPKGFGFDSLS